MTISSVLEARAADSGNMGGMKKKARMATKHGKSTGTPFDSKSKKRKASLAESLHSESTDAMTHRKQSAIVKSKPGKLLKRDTGSGSAAKSAAMPMERASKPGAKQQPNKKPKNNKVNADD